MLDPGRTLPARRFLCTVLAACVMASSPAQGQNQTQQEEMTQHEQKLAAARAAKDQKEEAQQLLDLGQVYSQAGQKQKWTAATLFMALVVVHETFFGKLSREKLEVLYKESAIYGTSLHMPPEEWPKTLD